ncbi:START domain-containing protein [Hahella aquimaris]|uniref:START domain-containing protein n=1 Tax=Hahella sp. HNIBRBA332 TaxID=3015983 RepID=UPI00273B93F1|nr:START domain-containing protein [Hahella sp. HNIBRBA332]WLQ11565.1 START domain-containing protein [Hahella sp. HNIBRBA332]
MDSEQWRLEFNKDGVKIFTMDFPGSDFKAFKAETVLNTPLRSILAVMADPTSCMKWVHGCIASEEVERGSFTKRYAYSVNDLPWPVRDRDYVLEISTQRDPATEEVTMDMYAVDGKVPEKDKYVRVHQQETHYSFQPQGETQTRMTWLQHTEPAGAIPSWLVNSLIVDIPYKSMRALEKLANSDPYRNARVRYDDAGNVVGVETKAEQ